MAKTRAEYRRMVQEWNPELSAAQVEAYLDERVPQPDPLVEALDLDRVAPYQESPQESLGAFPTDVGRSPPALPPSMPSTPSTPSTPLKTAEEWDEQFAMIRESDIGSGAKQYYETEEAIRDVPESRRAPLEARQRSREIDLPGGDLPGGQLRPPLPPPHQQFAESLRAARGSSRDPARLFQRRIPEDDWPSDENLASMTLNDLIKRSGAKSLSLPELRYFNNVLSNREGLLAPLAGISPQNIQRAAKDPTGLTSSLFTLTPEHREALASAGYGDSFEDLQAAFDELLNIRDELKRVDAQQNALQKIARDTLGIQPSEFRQYDIGADKATKAPAKVKTPAKASPPRRRAPAKAAPKPKTKPKTKATPKTAPAAPAAPAADEDQMATLMKLMEGIREDSAELKKLGE